MSNKSNITRLQYKTGKLFDVKKVNESIFIVQLNESVIDFVGGADAKRFESYLRKSFRHFYNLDKSLKPNKRNGRLAINKF